MVRCAYVRTVGDRVERRYVYGRTRQEATAKLVELQKRHSDGLAAGSTALTVERFLAEWLVHVGRRVRPQTYAGYENNVRLHIVPRIGLKKLSRLTVRDVRIMVDDMRDSGMSPRMVQWVHSTLRAALQHAFAEDLVTRNVARGVRIETPDKITTIEPFTEPFPVWSAGRDECLNGLDECGGLAGAGAGLAQTSDRS